MVTNGRTGIDEVRTARAWLASAAEPAGTALWEFVQAEGPVEAARALKRGLGPGRDAPGALLTDVDGQPPGDRAAADLDEIARLDGRLVIPEDVEWPTAALAPLEAATMAGVREVAPPLALWVRGPGRLDELLDRAVTVIGSYSATPYGEHVAADLGHGLAAAKWSVVSGGDFGIDAAAHRGALVAAAGSTVAVLAGGLGRLHPAAHAALFDRLARSGALISEWPPNATPTGRRFLLRNRVLAAVGLATVVVEAGVRSGVLPTARYAGTLGRHLLAVPGPVTSAESAGPHVLIRDGAGLVTSSADVLSVLGGPVAAPAPTGARPMSDIAVRHQRATNHGNDQNQNAIDHPGRSRPVRRLQPPRGAAAAGREREALMRYTVQVVRTVRTEVEVEADSPTEALTKVDRRDFPLPDPAEWSVLKGSYEYLVMGPQSAVSASDWPADDLATDGGRSGV